jgi:hypothetical protein
MTHLEICEHYLGQYFSSTLNHREAENLAPMIHRLGIMRSYWRQFSDAAKHFRQATDLYYMIPDPSDRLIIAIMKSGREFLSISHHLVDHEPLDSQQPSEAFDWIRKTQTKILGGNHHEIISTLLGKAQMLYYRLNNAKLAFSVACEALELVESCETATDYDLLVLYSVMANYCPEEDEKIFSYIIASSVYSMGKIAVAWVHLQDLSYIERPRDWWTWRNIATDSKCCDK